MRAAGADDELIRAATRPEAPPLVPELRVRLAADVIEAWEAAERLAGRRLPPPYWAVAWPGSQALARHLLDHRHLVAGRRVLDFASGCGLAAIAAAVAGAARVLASDLDPLAAAAQRLNAAACGVEVDPTTDDLVGRPLEDVDLVLAGDVCYERGPSARIAAWLRDLAARGATVLLADPGRTFAPTDDLEALATYVVPTSRALERRERTPTTVWRVLPVT
ncbi:MAG: methyltransferase [Planctomycetes bacterium]|nr:methyltransferase [Planctomycetota bacterium]